MLDFDPTRIEAKREGRVILARLAGIPLEDAAPFFVDATHKNFRDCFNAFVEKFPSQVKQMNKNRPDGVGPGELVAWFIFNNLTLGGRHAALDLLVDGEPFAEMKAGQNTLKTGTLDNFKITKDTDAAVNTLLTDLVSFNSVYGSITGQDLPGWNSISSIGTTVLNMWKSINLTKLQRVSPPIKRRRYIPVDPDGTILDFDEEKVVGSVGDSDIQEKLYDILSQEHKVFVDTKTDTIEKVIARWRKQAFSDYVGGKSFALVSTKTGLMEHFGEITNEMLDLYCVHRNQPWARIHLKTSLK